MKKIAIAIFVMVFLILSVSVPFAATKQRPFSKYKLKSIVKKNLLKKISFNVTEPQINSKNIIASDGDQDLLSYPSKNNNELWLDWTGTNKPLDYQEYLRINPFFDNHLQPRYYLEETTKLSNVDNNDNDRTIPLILIFKDAGLGDDINNEYGQFIWDLYDEGYTVITITWEQGSAEDLRAELVATYNDPIRAWRGVLEPGSYQLVGSILLGNLPVPWIEFDICNNRHIENPSVYPYMDLDAQWLDQDGDGIYDNHNDGVWEVRREIADTVTVHTDPQGTLEPEIWCGVIPFPAGLDRETAINRLRNYFNRNHQFRAGGDLRGGMVFIKDDDFASIFSPYAAGLVKMDKIREITDYTASNADEFKRYVLGELIILPDGNIGLPPAQPPVLVDVAVHGDASLLAFKKRFRGENGSSVVIDDFNNGGRVNPYFTVLQSCGPNRITEDDYIGSHILFAEHTNGLSVLSSSGSYFLHPLDGFYKGISRPEATLGDAYKELFAEVMRNPIIDMRQVLRQLPGTPPKLSLCYSQILLGDPTLKPINHIALVNKGNQAEVEKYLKSKYYSGVLSDLQVMGMRVLFDADGEFDSVRFDWQYLNKNRLETYIISGEYCGGEFSFMKVRPLPYEPINNVIYEIYIDGRMVLAVPLQGETQIGLRNLAEGEHTIRVVVDAWDTLVEEDEDNNSLEKTIRIFRDENDITQRITGLSFSKDPANPFTLTHLGYLASNWWLKIDQVVNICNNRIQIHDSYRLWTNERAGEITSEDLGDNARLGVSPQKLCLLTEIGLDEPFAEYTFNAELTGIDNNVFSQRLRLKY